MHKWNCYVALLFTILAILFCSGSIAKENIPYNNIIFFGDSLSDNGNLYNHDLGILPKSPPYYKGRFSNGIVWSEIAATYYHSKNITSDNYAVGGETTIFHDPVEGFLPYTLTESINSYYFQTINKDKTHTLYIIWIGANDYLNGNSDTNKITTEVIDTIQSSIEGLITHGAKNFLILNLPDLSKTPEGAAGGKAENLSILTTLHNTKLELAVSKLQNSHHDVNLHLFNIDQLFMKLLTNPDFYNHKYNTNIRNTTAACWQGGYAIQQLNDQQQLIEAQLTADIKTPHQSKIATIDPHKLSQFIIASPDLAVAYDVGQQFLNGKEPCSDAQIYVFWDRVHPTAVVHSILSSILTEYIDQNYQHV